MALETGTYISDLVATNPTATDLKSQGDDHIRLLKSTIKASFPNVTGAATPTHNELNYVAGVTSAIQTQINAKAPTASPTFTGVPSAPTATTGTNTTQIATTAFVTQTAFASTLPNQTGNNGKLLTTDGSTASWTAALATGTVTSVGVSAPGLFTVTNSPVTGSGTLTLSYSGTALPSANGGTGQTSYTIGDILYASGTSALSKLAGVAVGSALLSAGTGTAPVWGAVPLGGGSQAVSGTLAVGNGGTGAITLTGLVKGNGTSAFTAASAGTDYVSPTGAETLTNKTLTGYTETVYAVSTTTPALSPTNGTVQTWTLSGNSTPTAGTWAAGQSMTLMIDDGTAYTITWTSLAVTWKTGAGTAPTLNTSGYTAIQLWKVGTTIYGARVGDA